MRLSNLNSSFTICESIEKKRKYIAKSLKDSGQDYNDEILEKLLEMLVETDPVAYKTNGKKTPFVNDILRWYISGKIDFPEDIDTTREALAIYNDAKQHGTVKPISDFSSPGAVRKEYGEAEKDSDTYGANAKLVDEDGQFKMYQIDDWNQGQICFSDSGWCVQHESHFDDYGPPYFMITKGKKRYALAHIESKQLMDVEDEPMEVDNIKPIKKFFLKLWPEFDEDHYAYAEFWPGGVEKVMQSPELSYYYAQTVIKGRWPEAESIIATSPNWSVRYAKGIKSRFPEGESVIIKDPTSAYWYANDVIKGRWIEAEPIIATIPKLELAVQYAIHNIKGRFPEAENRISQEGQQSHDYAVYAIKGRFPKGEKVIAGDLRSSSSYAISYAKNVIKGRWPAIEEEVLKNASRTYEYVSEIIEGPWPEGEDILATDYYNAFVYAKYWLKGRFPKGEPAIATEPYYIYKYASEILKRRWPEGEAFIIKNISDYNPNGAKWVWEDAKSILSYVLYIIRGPWPEIEEELKSWGGDIGQRYIEFAENGTNTPKYEHGLE